MNWVKNESLDLRRMKLIKSDLMGLFESASFDLIHPFDRSNYMFLKTTLIGDTPIRTRRADSSCPFVHANDSVLFFESCENDIKLNPS